MKVISLYLSLHRIDDRWAIWNLKPKTGKNYTILDDGANLIINTILKRRHLAPDSELMMKFSNKPFPNSYTMAWREKIGELNYYRLCRIKAAFPPSEFKSFKPVPMYVYVNLVVGDQD